MAPKVVVGIGEILWDVFGTEKHLGGAPANFAYHVHELGDRACSVSRVGRDGLGDEILRRLAEMGVPTDYIQIDARRPTGTVIVKLDKAGKPDFTITPDVAWDNVRWSDRLLKLAKRADAVCYGTLAQRGPVSRRTINRFLETAKGALRVCDLNLRAEFIGLNSADTGRMAVVTNAIRMADVLKLNDDELVILRRTFGRSERGDGLLLWLLREFRLRMVCLTLGAKGCVLRTLRKRVVQPGVKVKVADTVGSGDAFTAAMVNRMLRKRPLAEIAAFANRVGTYVASKPGATPGLEGLRP